MGPNEGEVYSDKYGRVKLKFFWDHYSKDDYDAGSCWVRIAQPWAGKKRGSHLLPHVGDEVVVSFLNGNVEEPIVIGSVYNSTQEPFLDGKENKTVHGFQSAQGHAFLLDDKKGSEKVSIQSKKDFELTSQEETKLTQKTFQSATTESMKLTQKTLELTADESVKISTGNGSGVTLQMAKDGNLSLSIGSSVTLKISPSGEVEFSGTSAIKMMGNLNVTGNIMATGNIIATGNVHGTNI